MVINDRTMNDSLKTLLKLEEKSLCPVFGMIKKKVQRMTHTTSEYAYITLTNKGRLVIYRFDEHSSRAETYEFITLTFGETSITQQGQYIVSLEFLTDTGTADVNFSFAPVVKDKELPHQTKNAEKMFRLLQKMTGEDAG